MALLSRAYVVDFAKKKQENNRNENYCRIAMHLYCCHEQGPSVQML